MKTFKQLMALLLVFVLVAACVPLGTITAFAAENDEASLSAVEAEIDAEPEKITEPAETDNEAAPSPDESAGTEPEEEHSSTEALEEDSLPSEPEEETPEPNPDEEETEPDPENPFLDLSNEFDPEVLDFLWELFPDGEIPMDFDLVDFFNSYTTYGGSSGSETGDGGGGGNAAGSGSSNMVAAGVTMQVVYYRYDQCYNRYNSHGSVVGTLQNGKALPWNSTGKDNGSSETTVFDTYTISPHTFIVKAQWNSYPYVYHFPNSGLAEDNCKFTWVGFTNYWFNYYNPGGKPETSPYIVRNETNGSLAIEQFLARIILGNSYGAWDKLDVAKGQTMATDSSLYAAVLKYLGASDLAIQNYLDAYYGKLSISQNGSTLIPTIIWSWVGAENLGGTNRIYTIGDVAANGSSNTSWLKTAYTSGANCNEGFGACSWMKNSTDTMICKLMLGGKHSSNHNSSIWTSAGSSNLFGTGLVNRIQTQVDATAENGSNTFYYLRGYWTPYGSGKGSISLTKTNASGSAKLSGAEFTLYRDAACTIPVTSSDYETLSSSDTGYVGASVRRTNGSGLAQWTGLYTGTYFLKETKAPDGYQVNVDASGNVQVKEVTVSGGTSNVTLTNAENAKQVTLKKTINATQTCIDQIKGNPLYSLAGAEYSVTVNGKVVETLKTDANGNAASSQKYAVGTVLTIKETKAPAGYKLDTKTYTYTVTSGDNVISVSDVPVFDPPFVLTKVDKDTTTPQGDGSFTGAVFKWEFYANNNWSGTATRTWYFATDANGRCIYSKDYLASGYTSSALYVSPAGVNQLPLGTLKITEVKNSLGYTVIQDTLYCSIVADSSKASGAKHVWTAESAAILKAMANGDWGVNEPIDTSLFGSVTVDKYDAVTGQTPQGEATLAGAKFQVINSSKGSVVIGGKVIAPGGVCAELTTDAKGHASTSNILPVGTYTIKESAAPTGYLLNKGWQKTFSVTASYKDFSFTYDNGTGCPDIVIAGKIQITKKIVNTIDNTNAPEKGAKFSVTDSKGNVVDTIVTGSNGIGTSKDLPYGTYTVKQITGQTGTILCDPWTVTIAENGKVYEYSKENSLWTASVSVHKEEKGLKTPLSATFELCTRYLIREEQISLAKQMYIGFTEKQIALCEAEVGTGKTLSYLVAAIVAKHHNSRIYAQKLPVTITTSSIELQKALVEREIPNLSRMLLDYYIIEKPLTAVLRKGKEHYLCRYRFEDYLRNIKQYPEKYASTVELLEQMEDFRFGIDLDRYRISGAIKNRICIKGSCAGCSQKKQCKYHDFAKQMYHLPDLDFQVTNHNMYLMSQKTKSDDHPPLLRESCFVVVDEAHKFKEAAEDTFGERISEKDIPRYVNSVKTLCSPKANRDKYKEHLVSLISENETLFNNLRKKRHDDDVDEGRGSIITLSAFQTGKLNKILQLIEKIEQMKIKRNYGIPVTGSFLITAISAIKKGSQSTIWLDTDENGVLSLCSTPKDIHNILRRKVWDRNVSHVLTSGTISDGMDFAYFKAENGLDQIPKRMLLESRTESPFDYASHARLYIPTAMPIPNNDDDDYFKVIADEIYKIIQATNGHTAILFTSYKALKLVHELLKDKLAGYDTICMTRSNKSAIADFKKSKNGILFASGSMWEGVDCVGDCLSSVIIVRLPFPMRSALMEEKKDACDSVADFVDRYCTPNMLIKLRQGVGRLIRCESDTGIVSILDPRAVSKSYASKIDHALHKYPKVDSTEEIESFMRSVKHESYYTEKKEK